jgi:hypothetical protein
VGLPKHLHVTLYLTEEFKNASDRLWLNLMALDFCITEEHQKAGVIMGSYFGDLSALEKVPGVLSLVAREVELKPTTCPPRVAPKKQARGVQRRTSHDQGD